MAYCAEPGYVPKIHTKGNGFKEKTKVKSRGSVKGKRCGKYATFGTCLQQWLSLGILEDLMRRAKLRGTSNNPVADRNIA